jgi:hypothetical protein
LLSTVGSVGVLIAYGLITPSETVSRDSSVLSSTNRDIFTSYALELRLGALFLAVSFTAIALFWLELQLPTGRQQDDSSYGNKGQEHSHRSSIR